MKNQVGKFYLFLSFSLDECNLECREELECPWSAQQVEFINTLEPGSYDKEEELQNLRAYGCTIPGDDDPPPRRVLCCATDGKKPPYTYGKNKCS